MTDKKLYLIDAMALVFRAYYALIRSPRLTSDGINTNAQFGFTNTLYQLISKNKPSHLAVVWDTHAPTFRHEEFEEYKANREAAPEDLLNAIPDIKEIIEGFKIPSIEKDGYEADDLIATLAIKAASLDYEVFMITPDKDFGQVVQKNISILKPPRNGGDFEILGSEEVCKKWDIQRTDQVIDLLGMMGDQVDNIPGIKGIGEKTATKLLKQYDNLENVLAHADEIKGALGEKIRNGKEDAILSKKLATIYTDAPVEFDEKDFLLEKMDKGKLQQVFERLEFRTLANRIFSNDNNITTQQTTTAQGSLFGDNPPQTKQNTVQQFDLFGSLPETKNIENTAHQYHLINSEVALKDFLEEALQQNEIAFDTETTGIDPCLAELVGMSFSWKTHEAYYIPCNENATATKNILDKLEPLFADKTKHWIGQNIKYDFIILKNYGVEIAGDYFDTMLAGYSILPGGKQGMDALSYQYLQYDTVAIENLIGKKGKSQGSMKDVALETIKEYAAEDADVTYQLKQALAPKLKEESVEELFQKIENPLAKVLADMEFEGVGLDVNFLRNYDKELGEEIEKVEKEIYKMAGVAFNMASPKQLGEVLFEKMQLEDNPKKTKTGQYATGEDILKKLSARHPIIELILSYRELSKLKSTYVSALPELINPKTGRLHTSFNQVVVSSGRLSSNNPNLQNIPIRTERGREIRKAFIPRNEDYTLLSSDYSQIELRVVAALSGDEHMIEAFKQDKDIHKATAAKVYGVSEDEVTSEMRRSAKAVNFGIIYGQSAFGLSESLNIPRSEAKYIIDSYFREYHAIKTFMDKTINFAKNHGYVQTMKGRKIFLADINSRNATVRGFAERVAINAPIQGSAADMIKLAMINIHHELKKRNLKTKMILQVHDELVFDVYNSEMEEVKELIKYEMENALQLPNGVPAKAEAGTGKNWLDAH